MQIFSPSILLPPKENELEISVFGPGYGESIVLHVPGIGWGVVDSCIKKIEGASVVLPLVYLSSLSSPPSKLAFVILTHPHEDHYAGLEAIIKQYSGHIERVCHYNGDGVRELKLYIAQRIHGGVKELSGLSDVFRAMNDATKSDTVLRSLGEMTTVFDRENVQIEGYGLTRVRMMALSPSAMSIQKYVNQLRGAIDLKPGTPVFSMKDEAHNLISVGLFLSLGNLQIILGSDLESGLENNTGWKGVIFNKDCPDLWANFVKVSHHGSENGFNPIVWEKHSSRSKPITVITPFNRASRPLPQKEEVERFEKFSAKIGITADIREEKNLYKYYRRDVISALKIHTRSIKIFETSKNIGFIRVRFLPDGTVVERHAESPAFWH